MGRILARICRERFRSPSVGLRESDSKHALVQSEAGLLLDIMAIIRRSKTSVVFPWAFRSCVVCGVHTGRIVWQERCRLWLHLLIERLFKWWINENGFVTYLRVHPLELRHSH